MTRTKHLNEFDDIEIYDTGRCVDCGDPFTRPSLDEHGQRIFKTPDGYVCKTCYARRDA